jgi:branched-chain amino acid transport system permease protein
VGLLSWSYDPHPRRHLGRFFPIGIQIYAMGLGAIGVLRSSCARAASLRLTGCWTARGLRILSVTPAAFMSSGRLIAIASGRRLANANPGVCTSPWWVHCSWSAGSFRMPSDVPSRPGTVHLQRRVEIVVIVVMALRCSSASAYALGQEDGAVFGAVPAVAVAGSVVALRAPGLVLLDRLSSRNATVGS